MKKRMNKKLFALAMMAALCGSSVSTMADDPNLEHYHYYEEVDLDLDDMVIIRGNLKGIYPIFNEDSITMGGVCDGNEEYMAYRWEYCKIGEDTWHIINNWNSSQWCTWYPDANEEYAVVCRMGPNVFNGLDWDMISITENEAIWYVSRPQMQKKVTGKCAVPTSDGLLFGCTSNLTKNDTDYYTSCYIWSHEKQAWIAQASYQASDSAWFKVSSLPKGTYMMYTCTEKKMSNGEMRTLSSDYYLFSN